MRDLEYKCSYSKHNNITSLHTAVLWNQIWRLRKFKFFKHVYKEENYILECNVVYGTKCI